MSSYSLGGDGDGKKSDSIPEEVFTYEYNENGQLLKEFIDYEGGGEDADKPDGNPDVVMHYIYDGVSNDYIAVGYDNNVDNIIDYWDLNSPEERIEKNKEEIEKSSND